MKEFYSTSEAAKMLGVSRITVFNRIKTGKIEAKRFGRNYFISSSSLPRQEKTAGSDSDKNNDLREGVKRVVREYGTTLKKLGAE